jgi:hypothetical protein
MNAKANAHQFAGDEMNVTFWEYVLTVPTPT